MPCSPRVTGGIPGMIHLSQATRDALTGSYQLTEGNGGSRDQYLADNNIHTFLIGTGPTPFIHRWLFTTVISADCCSFSWIFPLRLEAWNNQLYRNQSKMSSSKKTCKGSLRQVLICLRPPPLLSFRLGWSS
jgi:hypothetical protein